MPRSFADFTQHAAAARFRVAALEARQDGELRARIRSAALRRSALDTDFIVRGFRWRAWIDAAYVHNLAAAVGQLRELGVTPWSLEGELAQGQPRPWTPATARRVHRGFQRAAVVKIGRQESFAIAAWPLLRASLDQWQLNVLPGRRVDRLLAALHWLGKATPPRVVAALLRTITDCWITARRMPQRVRTRCSCMMMCDADDSIQHYASCIKVHEVGRQELGLARLATPGERLASFVGVAWAAPAEHGQQVRRRAILTTAVYKLHCWWRHAATPPQTAAGMQQALRVKLREVLVAESTEPAYFGRRQAWQRD